MVESETQRIPQYMGLLFGGKAQLHLPMPKQKQTILAEPAVKKARFNIHASFLALVKSRPLCCIVRSIK